MCSEPFCGMVVVLCSSPLQHTPPLIALHDDLCIRCKRSFHRTELVPPTPAQTRRQVVSASCGSHIAVKMSRSGHSKYVAVHMLWVWGAEGRCLGAEIVHQSCQAFDGFANAAQALCARNKIMTDWPIQTLTDAKYVHLSKPRAEADRT
jgi:DNA-directed RNA polymerase subunit RPC12/RpoP